MELRAQEDPYAGQLQRIKQAIFEHYPRGKTRKRRLLEQAFEDAERHHEGQFRKSGEPVIIHPYRVALLVAEAGLDVESAIVALLHDIIEDTEVTKEEIRERYGDWMADVVDGLTKVARPAQRGQEASLENFRKLLFSTIKDIRTLLVKIFDRLDNMRDLSHLDRRRQRRISGETLAVYVPLAERMGLADIAEELSTLCFRFLYPKRFKRALDDLRARNTAEQSHVAELQQVLSDALAAARLSDAVVEPRFHQVFEAVRNPRPDLGGLREMKVIVPTARTCYLAMGALHMACRAVPNSIRDYISNPKPNRYQALESELFLGTEVVPVSIASRKMEQTNRSGVLANWKRSQEELARYYQTYLELIDQLDNDADLRMEDVLRYAQVETVQAFTPRGQPLNFPPGSTVLDFAYAIHSDLGNRCSGAMVGGRRVGRFTELRDGDMVSVITSPEVSPTPDWLDHVRTTRARIQVRRTLRALSLARAEEVGRELFAAELGRLDEDAEAVRARPEFAAALEARSLTEQQFFQQVGTRKLALRPFLVEARLVPAKKVRRRESWERSILSRYVVSMFRAPDPDLRVQRTGDVFVQKARCCSPLHGDSIVGVQREHGITIHRAGCDMLEQVDPAAQVSVGWDLDPDKTSYQVVLTVDDRPGMIYKIGKVMNALHVSIHDIVTRREPQQGQATITIDIEPVTTKTYQRIVSRLRGLRHVRAVH